MYIRKTIRSLIKFELITGGQKICFNIGQMFQEIFSGSKIKISIRALYKIVFNLNNTLRNSYVSKPRWLIK